MCGWRRTTALQRSDHCSGLGAARRSQARPQRHVVGGEHAWRGVGRADIAVGASIAYDQVVPAACKAAGHAGCSTTRLTGLMSKQRLQRQRVRLVPA